VTAGGGRSSGSGEDEDGLVSLAFRFEHRHAAPAGLHS